MRQVVAALIFVVFVYGCSKPPTKEEIRKRRKALAAQETTDSQEELKSKALARGKPKIYETWPFDEAEAKQRQRETAERLGTEVEAELELGNGTKLKLVLIPAGCFMMGSPETEKGREEDELLHEVTLTKPYWIGKYETQVSEFRRFVEATGFEATSEIKKSEGREATWKEPRHEKGENYPVVEVTWEDAQAFCKWASGQTGRNVRLPTEAEWEYAARAGTQTAYIWGDNPDDGKGWGNANDLEVKDKYPDEETFNWRDGYPNPAPVGQFRPNRFGLYDMFGNAAELCEDAFDDYPRGAVKDPKGTADRLKGSYRATRGGSCYGFPEGGRSASRHKDFIVHWFTGMTFRVVVEIEP